MYQPLHIFISAVYPRYADMNAERSLRLREHDRRITLLHEHVLKRPDCAIVNPVNGLMRRTSDTFPVLNFREPPVIEKSLKQMLEQEQAQETIRRDLQYLQKSQFAIIDLTYLEGGDETDKISGIEEILNMAREKQIPHLLTRESATARNNAVTAMSHSKLNLHCYLATYPDDQALCACVDHALSAIFSLPNREAKTDPQIPSLLLEFKKRA